MDNNDKQHDNESPEPIDPELLEVFLEEVDEVLAEVTVHFSTCREEPVNHAAWKELRRGFHTIKGSGRMVNAIDIADIGWAVEDVMNKVLDRSLVLDEQVKFLIQYAIEVIPTLIQSIADPSAESADLEKIKQISQDIIQGKTISLSDKPYHPAGGIPSDSQESTSSPNSDPNLIIIFKKEALTHLNVIKVFLADFQSRFQGDYPDLLDQTLLEPERVRELNRSLHTLKGSASIAEVFSVAYMVSPVEQMFKEAYIKLGGISRQSISILSRLADKIDRLLNMTPEQLLDVSNKDEGFIVDVMRYLREIEDLEKGPESGISLKAKKGNIIELFDGGMDLIFDAEKFIKKLSTKRPGLKRLANLIDEMEAFFEHVEKNDLKDIALLCELMIGCYKKIASKEIKADDALVELLIESNKVLMVMVDDLICGNITAIPTELAGRLESIVSDAVYEEAICTLDESVAQASAVDANTVASESGPLPEEIFYLTVPEESDEESFNELLAIFTDEASELLESISESMEQWTSNPEDVTPVVNLQRYLHTLKGGAALSEITPVADLAHQLETIYEGICSGLFQYSDELKKLLMACHDTLLIQIDSIISQRYCSTAPYHLSELSRYIQNPSDYDWIEQTDQGEVKTTPDAQERPEPQTQSDWVETHEQSQAVDIESETVVHDETAAALAPEAALATPELPALFESDVEADDQVGSPGALLEQIKPNLESNEPPQPPSTEVASEHIAPPSLQPIGATPDPSDKKSLPTQQESVKVSSELLESLVNLAGESSISRARLEQEITDFGFELEEMSTTISRLKDLLRRLDIETEAQIISNFEKMSEHYNLDFDPLELDRYSSLHQLTRSLGESVSDLTDIRSTLFDRIRNSESLITQQEKIHIELQEGLIQTRMVPLSRVTPRLRRLVRKIGREIGKNAELEAVNADGELDRTILERLISPLEHMIRNSMDHGIESAELRQAAEKPKYGRITLMFTREGSEIILTISDDGAGIRLDKVRQKAVEKGFLAENSQLSDDDIMQFILKPGFSTAASVTQISGRGVGMDVVNNEIKQMGGSMKIQSKVGQGTTFVIRLPFTVSVNRALMIKINDDSYAIPISQVEGVVRVAPEDIVEFYEGKPLSYLGKNYQIQYFGYYVHNVVKPNLSNNLSPVPLLLIKGDENPVALHVDSLIGSKEVVVKSVGPQLSTVAGLSGATILGDGSVVIILDILSLIRSVNSDPALLSRRHEDAEQTELGTASRKGAISRSTPLVLVVDDSVTVRKVTTRLLQRYGFDVLTAKDGVEAMSVLHETQPDIMLLDIEMPVMDGFEVATQVRHSEVLKNIPIIMITSRSGEKHRNRASEIGVDEYVIKPFQEKLLLESISNHLSDEIAHLL